jgi:hypothetical protein
MSDTTGTPDESGTTEGGGPEGTIPSGPTGVGVGAGKPSHFEPEEDEGDDAQPDADAEPGADDLGAAGHA